MTSPKTALILIRGGGDLASGVALRLFRSGFGVVITEVESPLMVRRTVSFAEALFEGAWTVEGVKAKRCANPAEALQAIDAGNIPVMVDPSAECRFKLSFLAAVDGRMLKRADCDSLFPELFSIGLGPGFIVSVNCNAVVETNRGAALGRVYWNGSAEGDTGLPEFVGDRGSERVLRALRNGRFTALREIGEIVDAGEQIAEIDGEPVSAPFKGVIRGLLRSGTSVRQGLKIGDIDPRCDANLCRFASDKALAVGGGVLEALLSRADIREQLGGQVE